MKYSDRDRDQDPLHKDMNYNKIYMIIPFRGSVMRNDNILKLLRYIDSIMKGINIIIGEHDFYSKLSLNKNLYSNLNISHYFLKCEEDVLFDRTGIINYLIKKCPDNSIIINNDCDCIIESDAYRKAILNIQEDLYDYIVPYNGYGYNVSNDFNFNRDLTKEESIPRWICACGGIIIFKKNVYETLGLENEFIISWGYEDFERFYRVTTMHDINRIISPIAGGRGNGKDRFFNNNKMFENYSLYHFDHNSERDENSSNNPKKNFNKNISLYVKSLTKEELQNYIYIYMDKQTIQV